MATPPRHPDQHGECRRGERAERRGDNEQRRGQ
jgi:hypothetical protein